MYQSGDPSWIDQTRGDGQGGGSEERPVEERRLNQEFRLCMG